MREQHSFDFGAGEPAEADLLKSLMDRCERVLLKKLSNNDRDWAKLSNKHQAGVYIPAVQRDGEFFPPLVEKNRSDPQTPAIREAWFRTIWPQAAADELEKMTRLVHYTSKGQETHMTRLPKEPFAHLSPASYIVMGRVRQGEDLVYECLTIDSNSDDAALLLELLDITPEFMVGEFVPQDIRDREREKILDFAGEVISAWQAGALAEFARTRAALPPTEALARMARERFLQINGLDNLDPFAMRCPGDALREISRSIEWEMFREYQRRERAVSLVRIVLGEEPREMTMPDMIRRLIDELPAIDALMLSASQQRKSRAGYSYEHHIEAMLGGGGIPFEKQVVIEARKRPDFILPSLAFLNLGGPQEAAGLILSAKTTLRERWKQVEREKGTRALYLTTVDESIAGNAIQDMGSFGVHLVIPEALMLAKETEYKGHANVLTFRRFCDEVVTPRLAGWMAA